MIKGEMKRSIFIMICLMTVFVSTVFAADKKNTGQISGTIITIDREPLVKGTAVFFSAVIGPLPSTVKYMRMPDNVASTDSKGKFSTVLPEGSYYIGGMKHVTEARIGPPREGDIFFISNDENGIPKSYRVNKGTNDDLGIISETESAEQVVKEEITAFEGTIRDKNGKPVKDAVVLAYSASTMDRGLTFASDYSNEDGRFLLKVHNGGKFYLNIIGQFGSLFYPSGITISGDLEDESGGVTVSTDKIRKNVDITMTMSN